MIYLVTLLKDLPYVDKGFCFYLRGDKVADARQRGKKKYRDPHGDEKDVLEIKHNQEWVSVIKTKLKDDRPHLSKVIDKKLYTVHEVLRELDWQFKETGEHGAEDITCCGERVKIGGWVGAEHAHCEKCGKGFQDMTGILPAGNSSVGLIEAEYQADDGRVYLPERYF